MIISGTNIKRLWIKRCIYGWVQLVFIQSTKNYGVAYLFRALCQLLENQRSLRHSSCTGEAQSQVSTTTQQRKTVCRVETVTMEAQSQMEAQWVGGKSLHGGKDPGFHLPIVVCTCMYIWERLVWMRVWMYMRQFQSRSHMFLSLCNTNLILHNI
jgi:ribosomal protein L29